MWRQGGHDCDVGGARCARAPNHYLTPSGPSAVFRPDVPAHCQPVPPGRVNYIHRYEYYINRLPQAQGSVSIKMNVTKAGIPVETVEPQTAADDGGSTFELVCGRKSNHLPLPGIGQDQPDGSPSSDVDYHVPILDKPPQNKRQDEQKSDTGYVSQQQSCSTDPNREEWVGGCVVFHRVGRPPVGMRAGPLPRCLLPIVQELARAGAGGRTASTAKR